MSYVEDVTNKCVAVMDKDSGHGNLGEHLLNVERKIEEITKEEYSLFRGVGLLHDVGKISKEWCLDNSGKNENKKSRKKKKFRHPIAALPVAKRFLSKLGDEKDKLYMKLLTIYYHHTEFSLNILQKDLLKALQDKEEFWDRVVIDSEEWEVLRGYLKDKSVELFGKEIDIGPYPEDIKKEFTEILKELYLKFRSGVESEDKRLLGRMYSVLVEADWKSSEKEEIVIDWKVLKDTFESRFRERIKNRADELSSVRNEIREMAGKHGRDEKTIGILFAPTGSGKTEAAISWALERAIKNNARRIIFVLPFKSLIEDQYERFVEYFGEENVSVWNSDWPLFYIQKRKELPRDKEEFLMWLALYKHFIKTPIILTTADQMIAAFFNVGRYAIRYGIMQNSIIVFDEIHSYDPSLRSYIYVLVKDLRLMNVLLMTATPPIEGETGYIEEMLPHSGIIGKERKQEWFKRFLEKRNGLKIEHLDLGKNRNKLKDLVDKFVEEVLIFKNKNGNVLASIMLNTVEYAKAVYKKLMHKIKDEDVEEIKIVLLHSEMTGEDKERVIDSIKKSKEKGRNIIVVSTQVIEAGIDFSFHIMYRQIAPIEALIQAAGRVNRYGEYNYSKFVVFYLGNERHPYGKEEKLKSIWKKIKGVFENQQATIEILNNLLMESDVRWESSEEVKRAVYDSFVTSSIASKIIWSFGTISEILPDSLREGVNKVELLVMEDNEVKNWMEVKKDKLKEWLLLRSMKTVSIKIWTYSKLIKDGKVKKIGDIEYISPKVYEEKIWK